MRWSLVVPALLIFLPLPSFAGDAKPLPGVAAWDTRRPVPAVLPLAKNEWSVIPLGRTADAFKGDAVLSKGRIVAVLRRKDAAVEVHAVKRDGAISRVRLRLQ